MRKLVFNTTRAIYGAFFCAILIIVTFCAGITYACNRDHFIPNCVSLLFIAAVFAVCFAVSRQKRDPLQEKSASDFDRAVLAATVVLFFFQVYICYNTLFLTGWDAGNITNNAEALANGRLKDHFDYYYFSTYPNNLLLLFIEAFIFKLNLTLGVFTGSQALMSTAVVNCALSSLTCLLTYKSAKLLVDKRCALFAFIAAVCLVGLSPWIVIFYSDSLGLIFPIFTFYMFYRPYKKRFFAWAGRAAAIFAACVGYFIKPQCAIILIALVIIETVHRISSKEKKDLLKLASSFVCIVLSMLIIKGGLSIACKRNNIELDPELKIGMIHFVMMGLNPETKGVFSSDDVLYSRSYTTVKERNAADIERLKSRAAEMGVGGVALQGLRKTLTIFNDGNFAYSCEGEFYTIIYDAPNTAAAPFLRSVFHEYGSNFYYLAQFEQVIWLAVMLFAAFAAFTRFTRKGSRPINVLMLTLVGLTVFELLFEARARYLYTCVPVFCVLAAVGLENAFALASKAADRKKRPAAPAKSEPASA